MQAPKASSLTVWPPLLIWPGLTGYETARKRQQELVAGLLEGGAGEKLVFCEHPPVITVGTSGNSEAEVLTAGDYPVIETERGGKTTYHGPGQRVVYPIMDLNQRGRDVRGYVRNLQQWLIDSLKEIGVAAYAGDEIGVWTKTENREEKIAAIGIRVRRWVTFHGVAVNVTTDLADFEKIVPCGIKGKGVTSLQKLGLTITMAEFDQVLMRHFGTYFPPLEHHEQPDQSSRTHANP